MFSFCVCAFWLYHYSSHVDKFSEQACRIKKKLDCEQTVCGIFYFFWLIGVIQFTEERGFNTGSDESNNVFSLFYDSILHIFCRHKDLQFSAPTRQHTQLTLYLVDFYKSNYFLLKQRKYSNHKKSCYPRCWEKKGKNASDNKSHCGLYCLLCWLKQYQIIVVLIS